MTQLVLQAMRRIVADFDDRQRVITVVKSALAAVRNQKQITLRVATRSARYAQGRDR